MQEGALTRSPSRVEQVRNHVHEGLWLDLTILSQLIEVQLVFEPVGPGDENRMKTVQVTTLS